MEVVTGGGVCSMVFPMSAQPIGVNPPPAAAAARSRMPEQWWLLCGFWLLIAAGSLIDMALFRPPNAGDALRFAAMQWLPWVLLTPLIVWISSVYPLGRSTWLRNIWIYLVACIIITGALGTVAYLQRAALPPPMNGPRPFPPGEGPGPPGMGDRPFPPQGRRSASGDRPFPPPGADRFSGPPRRGPPPSAAFRILRQATFQLPAFWVVVAMAHGLQFYQRAKNRERREIELESLLVEARLQALRTQLNPHFLFNTLNSIASLVYDDPRAADEMIGSLSDLLRLALGASDRQEVTLREELHFLDQYLRIEQARFGERLRVEREIEPDALDAIVPILILQPLVENAVKHGIEKQLAPGVVQIAAKRSGGALHLQVTDNGRGAANGDGKLNEGVGLGNTRARLRGLYGERGSLKLYAPDEGGFSVAVQIPWRAEPALSAAQKA